MLIEIKGVQFVNKGAELMLASIISQLAKELPSADICLAHNKNSPYKNRARVGAYQKINLRKNIIDLNGVFYFFPRFILNYFKNRFGIVTEADVDVVLDASGFSYGDQWSDVIIKQVANEVSRFKKKRKHYIFMPQSLGPFTRKSNRLSAKKAFKNASLVFAREEPSYKHVMDLVSESSHIAQAPDFTNLLIPTELSEYTKYKDHIIIIPNSKMQSNKNKDDWWREHYVETLAFLVNKAQEANEKVIIVNHSGFEDAILCDEINQLIAKPCEVIEPKDAKGVKYLISNGKLVISSRFHGCVSSLSQGVPCIATGWSHKYQELFNEYEVSDMLIASGITNEQLSTLLNITLKQLEQKKSGLEKYIISYKQKSEKMWLQVFDILK
ncbi:polysaccharide pyruvyl transferase family protein [Pseudoalteromonas sp. SSMSWG5]|uniref:polysaccharide pyruvyl transferase family protein n=1 Tax=unclassified Pseudoalteromonas TaxID=194690 RepID=UPI001108C400|nr:polysaccharide pyruvyl transferase family protein [Pseudoalteromonas sp. S4389]MCO7251775.1 polysaccharide pyruvyl transferase family protein [Pseudoalteromonas sp. Ps84H-4]TMO40790.1 polysaccharide pyruvyl transferase family protein [Pseudoalteromonas sp. S4389]